MTDSIAADLALALRIADAADEVTMARFGAVDLRVDSKPDRTPVSDADRQVEREMRRLLATRRPGDAVLGEEYGLQGEGPRVWVLDPVDGTKNYIRRSPIWATLIALKVDETFTVGVASAPALGRRWYAGTGLGCWTTHSRDPGPAAAPCHVSRVTSLHDAFVVHSNIDRWRDAGRESQFAHLADSAWYTRGYGDFWQHMLVAEGVADVSLDPGVSLWDLAAVSVIVSEAGGRLTDLEGRARADGGSAVCSNGHLHEEVLGVLGGPASLP